MSFNPRLQDPPTAVVHRSHRLMAAGAGMAALALAAAGCGASSPSSSRVAGGGSTTSTVPNATASNGVAGPGAAASPSSTGAPGSPSSPAASGAKSSAAPAPAPSNSAAPSPSRGSSGPGSSGSTASGGSASGTSGTTNCANTLSSSCDTQDASGSLSGAGSTFDQPLFSRAFYAYHQANPKVSVSYAAVGSGAGISDIKNQTVDFGATDVPLSPPSGNGGNILEIPVALGGVAVAYNVPGVNQGLKLSGSVLAAIYSGSITKWNDQQIKNLNPGTDLPDQTIETVHRADSSGTSYIFTDYLNHVDPSWSSSGPGVSKSPNWGKGNPNALGGNGNSGVAADIANTQYSIGYIELAYALQANLTYAQMQNHAGSFVYPTLSTVSTAASQFPNVSWQNFSIVDAPGSGSYPICGYSWGLVYENQPSQTRGAALGKLLDWESSTGQKQASAIGYAPLPANIQALAHNTILQMKFNGSALFR